MIPSAAAANVRASVEPIPNNMLFKRPVSARAPARPSAAIPIMARDTLWRTTKATTSARAAPSAMRTPISCVRCATE